MDLNVLINIMIKLFIMGFLGYLLKKKNMLDEEGDRIISSLVVNITCPLLVITSVGSASNGNRSEILMVLALGIGVYCMLPFFARLCTKIFKIKEGTIGTYEFMLIFANTSFIGFPIVQSLFGDEAVFYTAVLHLPFDILVFSYGLYIILKDKNIKGGESFKWKSIFNPGMILSVAALVIYLADIKIPSIINDSFYMIGNITTPLSMIVLGSSLGRLKFKDICADAEVYIFSIIRLFVIPALVYCLFGMIGIKGFVLNIATVTFAMPVGSMSVMFANEYKNNINLSAKAVFITTLASIITIPIIVRVFIS